MIIQFSDLKKRRDYKQSVVLNCLIDFYKNLQETSGIDIPYFLRARDKYNEIIKNNKDLNKYYNKIMDSCKHN